MPDEPSKSDPPSSRPESRTPPPVPSDETRAAQPVDAQDPLVGRVLVDRVRILRPIARGGMGRVYLGEQTRMSRRCAVKVLDPRWSNSAEAAEFARRFLLEASVAAKIAHPHVVTIFDYGESPDGCFIAMEYLEGRSLADELSRSGRLAPARAVHIATQMARALREAHALGVVHRDVKPPNVFLVRQDDDDDFVKVLDFGLVHEGKAGEAPDQPGPEPIMGSPRYMAPEQVQGKEVDARADVYSLGVVLYAMLAGRPPFERRTDLATMMAQVSDPPPPFASIEGLAVPPALEALVMRCLAKSPDDRWASMEELVGALTQGAPSAPRAVTSAAAAAGPRVEVPRAPRPRKSGAHGAVLAVFLASAAGLAALAIHGRSSRPVAPEASGGLPSAAPAPPPPAALAKATLHVETEPPGARVTEEGETLCAATPCDVLYTGAAADPSAEHLVALLLPGYKVERKIVKGTASPLHVKLTKSDR